LNDDVDHPVDVGLYFVPAEVDTGGQSQQGDLVEGPRGAVGMNRGERSRVAAVDGPQIGESFSTPQLAKQDAVGTKPQRGSQQCIGTAISPTLLG
jgi:hypothetical protein